MMNANSVPTYPVGIDEPYEGVKAFDITFHLVSGNTVFVAKKLVTYSELQESCRSIRGCFAARNGYFYEGLTSINANNVTHVEIVPA